MAKHKNRKSKNASVTSVAVDKLDRGTLQTRARISPDPLPSPTLEPHRAAAGLEIRSSIEEGYGGQGLDIVRIGMGGGASSGHYEKVPVQQRLLELHSWRAAWHRNAERKGVQIAFAEQFARYAEVFSAKGHTVKRTQDGKVDDEGYFYFEYPGAEASDEHSGPICITCGYGFCMYCDDQRIFG